MEVKILAKTLTMPVNSNQKQDEKNTWIYNAGCAVCSGVDMASFFNKKNYTVGDFSGLYSADKGYLWGTPKVGQVTYTFQKEDASKISEPDTIKRIKKYIDAGQPVACHAVGNGNEHWMVAYKYTDGTTWADIFVLDPAGTKGEASGALCTMKDGMSWSNTTAGVDTFRVKTLIK